MDARSSTSGGTAIQIRFRAFSLSWQNCGKFKLVFCLFSFFFLLDHVLFLWRDSHHCLKSLSLLSLNHHLSSQVLCSCASFKSFPLFFVSSTAHNGSLLSFRSLARIVPLMDHCSSRGKRLMSTRPNQLLPGSSRRTHSSMSHRAP